MALYGVRLVINLFDLCIYRRYLEEFIGNRKTSMEFSVLLLIVCELIGSAVNQMGISWLNFVTMVAILCVYVCQYEAGIVSRLIAVLLYMGIMGISEPAGYLFSKVFMEQIVEDDVVIYYFSAFLVVIFRLAIVEVFWQAESGKECKGVEYAKGNQLCAGTYSIMQPDQLLFTDRGCKRINLGTDGRAVHVHHLCHYHHKLYHLSDD